MYYSIRVNGSIVAKTNNTTVASHIVTLYGHGTEVKVINNVYNRIAFNNKRQHWSASYIVEAIDTKDKQFEDDYRKKTEEFLES